MELIANHQTKDIVHPTEIITESSSSNFIEANTKQVTIEHLKKDCIIPVFAKDNETTISHFEFINAAKVSNKKIIFVYFFHTFSQCLPNRNNKNRRNYRARKKRTK